MFGARRKKTVRKIIFIDAAGRRLRAYEIRTLPLREQSILEGSILFFDDPEPCMIHRGAVASRYIMEFDLWSQDLCRMEEPLPLERMPGKLAGYLEPEVFRDAAAFRIEEGTP